MRRPSRRTLATAAVVAVILGLLCVPPVFANTAIGYLPLIAAVVLLVLCFAYLLLLRRSLSFTEIGPSSGCTRGDVLQFALGVKNESFLPAVRIEAEFVITDADGGDERSQSRFLTLPPRSEHVFDLGVRFDHIGTYQVGIRQVGMFDPLGVFFSLRRNDDLHAVRIEPRIVDVASFELSDQSLLEAQKTIKTFISDGMDYSGIREYRPGDPMKSIHWKLSSKTVDDYFTRLYETPTSPGVALFMDFETTAKDRGLLPGLNDAVVESALSVERFAAAAGYETLLAFVDARGEARQLAGPLEGKYAGIMERIPRMRTGSGNALLELVRREAQNMNGRNNLVVCTSCVTDVLVSTLLDVQGPTRSPYLVAVVPRAESRERGSEVRRKLARLGEARVPFAVVTCADDLAGGGGAA